MFPLLLRVSVFFFQAEDGIRDYKVTGVQTCALPISFCERRTLPSDFHALKAVGSRRVSKVFSVESRFASSILRTLSRSEERRVGKEWRSRWGRSDYKKKDRERDETTREDRV